VTQIEGHRHYPSVVTEVERLLRDGISLDSVGQDGRSSADSVVLRVVNALPAEARMSVAQPNQPDRGMDEPAQPTQEYRTEPLTAEQYEQLSDEQIDAFTASVKV